MAETAALGPHLGAAATGVAGLPGGAVIAWFLDALEWPISGCGAWS